MGTEIDLEAALEIARLSRGVPREALRLLERSRDLAIVSDRKRISETDVQGVRERLGIDENGLRREERRILELLLDRGKPIGIRAMAETLGMRAETIEALYEPFLLRLGLIERTERGRVATEKARALSSGTRPTNGSPRYRIPILTQFRLGKSPPPREA